jgi:hypothetical protein
MTLLRGHGKNIQSLMLHFRDQPVQMVQLALRDQQVLQVLQDRKGHRVLQALRVLQVQPERQAQALILLALMLFSEEIQMLPRFQ